MRFLSKEVWTLLALRQIGGRGTAEEIERFLFQRAGQAFEVLAEVTYLRVQGMVEREWLPEAGSLAKRNRSPYFKLTEKGKRESEAWVRSMKAMFAKEGLK